MDRDDIIVQMFHELRGMVWNFAMRFDLEFDDWPSSAILTKRYDVPYK